MNGFITQTQKKHVICAALCLTLLLLAACGANIQATPEAPHVPVEPTENGTVVDPAEKSETESAQNCDFSELTGLEYYFSSGAGGWNTVMHIGEDGSLSGYFHDSEMGTTGEAYPNGTVYECNFTATLDSYTEIDEHSFSLAVRNLTYAPDGAERIADGIRFVTAEPYGLSENCTLVFYRKGTPIDTLPEAMQSWLRMPGSISDEDSVLNMLAVYNISDEYAFSSYPAVEQQEKPGISAELEEFAAKAAVIQNELEKQDLSQTEMNLKSGELFKLWDDELNSIWVRLQETLDAEAFRQLTKEELAWISLKEQKVSEEAADFEGGSIYPLICNTTAAQLTKDRVYELAEYLK